MNIPGLVVMLSNNEHLVLQGSNKHQTKQIRKQRYKRGKKYAKRITLLLPE